MRTELSEFEGLPRAHRDSLLLQEVASDIAAAAFSRGDFEMDSGEQTDYYIDKYVFESRPTILRRLAELLADRVPGDIDRLAAGDRGGVPLVTAVSLRSGLPFALIREVAGSQTVGTMGEIHRDERVVLIVDVVHSGRQALCLANKLEELGVTVACIQAVVDRGADGEENIRRAGFSYDFLFSRSDLNI